jgi:hypothetical protein
MGIEQLQGVREKLLRADELLQNIREAQADYVTTETFGIRGQFEEHIPEKTGRSGLTWRADLQPPPPLRIAVLCGDFVHNLRSALDHLSWALVVENGGTPRRDTQFPVLDDRLTAQGKIRPVTIAGGISPHAEVLLETVQPYQQVDDPTVHPLAALTDLWNIDKHRTLNVMGVNLGKVTIEFPRDNRKGIAQATPFADGALVFWVLTDNPAFDPEPHEMIEFRPSLALRDVARGSSNQPVPVLDLLEEFRRYIRDDVVDPFARLCFGDELNWPAPVFP